MQLIRRSQGWSVGVFPVGGSTVGGETSNTVFNVHSLFGEDYHFE